MCALALDIASQVHLATWLNTSTEIPSTLATTNQSALVMPFQRWFKFKEAFAPSFVVDMVQRLPYFPESCLDPFGGSGTTSLTCQFLGITPSTMEVNPFMADVIEAKLSSYDIADVQYSVRTSLRGARKKYAAIDCQKFFSSLPKTFIEPGVNGRWIFSIEVAKAIAALRLEIAELSNPETKRLLTVVLGSKLIELSNVVVNGKGRRYRGGWKYRAISAQKVFKVVEDAAFAAVADIYSFRRRKNIAYNLARGDARSLINDCDKVDFVLTSPPYPNSFDYTDIYNVELWMLGYLRSAPDNRFLRQQTLRSHVQVLHEKIIKQLSSSTLQKVYHQLCATRSDLWNPHIPEMICHYFTDMEIILKGCKNALKDGGHAMFAVGDSQYRDVRIDVATILAEIAQTQGFKLLNKEAVRSMRASAQQGGEYRLNESLLWLSS